MFGKKGGKGAASKRRPVLIIDRTFGAPPKAVFEAWTDKALVAKWWGPKGFTCQVHKLEARPGGAIRLELRSPQGAVYPMAGEFREVDNATKLEFMARAVYDKNNKPQLETTNTVIFKKFEGNSTSLTIHVVVNEFAQEAAAMLSGIEKVWMRSLDKLAGILPRTPHDAAPA